MKIHHWYIQIPIVTFPFVAISIFFPIIGWFSTVLVTHYIESISGINIPLTRYDENVTLGAVIVTTIYFGVCIYAFTELYKSNLKLGAAVVGVGTMCFCTYCYSSVSSLAWL